MVIFNTARSPSFASSDPGAVPVVVVGSTVAADANI
jgi:hypothetical protein